MLQKVEDRESDLLARFLPKAIDYIDGFFYAFRTIIVIYVAFREEVNV